ncbi:MAG: transporter [Planctomycetes bacterium]|nr:transporter [Planctomycetota bacterium]
MTRSPLLLLAATAPLLWALPAAGGELTTEVGGAFTTGEYGGPDRVDMWETYLRVGYRYARVSAALTLPIAHVRGGAGVPTGGGLVPLQPGDAAPLPGQVASDEEEGPRSATGLGDVRLELRVVVLDEGAWHPSLTLVAEVKAPTADPDRRLGTGEWDGGGGVVARKLIDRLVLQADLRVIAIGEPPGADLAPAVVTWQVSAGWRLPLTADAELVPFVFAGGQSRLVRGSEPPLEVGLGAWLTAGRVMAGVSGAFGLTDGSPDVAVGFSIGLLWDDVGPRP